jgi:hypothetical protein
LSLLAPSRPRFLRPDSPAGCHGGRCLAAMRVCLVPRLRPDVHRNCCSRRRAPGDGQTLRCSSWVAQRHAYAETTTTGVGVAPSFGSFCSPSRFGFQTARSWRPSVAGGTLRSPGAPLRVAHTGRRLNAAGTRAERALSLYPFPRSALLRAQKRRMKGAFWA